METYTQPPQEIYQSEIKQPELLKQLNTNKDPKYDEIVQQIRQKLPAGTTLIYVAIAGGRAKGFTNQDSDFDTKSIVLQPMTKYLLQDAKENFEINTSLSDGTKVEGQAIDIIKAFSYCQNGNIQLYEAFGGITIYQTEISNKIKELWLKQYDFGKVGYTFQGFIKQAQKKQENLNQQKEGQQMTTYKLGSELIYLSLKLFGVNKFRDTPPPFNFFELIERTKDELSEEQLVWIQEIIKKRCENKGELMIVDDKLREFIKLSQQKYTAFKFEQTKKIDIKSESDTIFLNIFGLQK